jgi:transcriptional regulator with XRE-family HTH domain
MKRDRDQPPFGRRLMELRQRLYRTQEEIAKKAGLSADMVGSLEQGRRQDPRLSTLRKLAFALDVTVAELIAQDEPALDA